jgi:hypothetical protein
MRNRVTPLLLAAALFAAAPARAQTPFTFVSGGNVAAFGYLVGAYTGIEGTGSTAHSLFLYCVDFGHHISVGETWDANVTSLASGTSLGDTRAGDMTLYREAAWLTTQYTLHPEATGDIQATIWNLFQPTPGIAASSSYWLTQAGMNYASLDYGAFAVVTDVRSSAADGAQEFIITVNPEPESLVLLATGLLGVFGAVRRKRSS